MSNTTLGDAYTSLPNEVKQVLLAFSILSDRIRSLSDADRDDVFELFLECRKANEAEREDLYRAIEEILAQYPLKARPLQPTASGKMPAGLHRWAEHAGKCIRKQRERAGLTQAELAEKAGLNQSHISRLENAEHSPNHITLKKIADALGVEIGKLDPSCD